MTALRNIEFKAWLTDFVGAQRIAAELATSWPGEERQTDTYFHARRGRLKLREIDGRGACLISYARTDLQAARPSDYRLVPIADAAALTAALAETLGVLVVVAKRREIYLAGNVRIHLDQVAGLGEFLEFEAVLRPGDSDASGHARLSDVGERFASVLGDAIATSYSDLLLAERGAVG